MRKVSGFRDGSVGGRNERLWIAQRVATLLALLFMHDAAVAAGPISFCLTAEKLSPQVEDCSQNRVFANAAKQCQDRFTRAVSKASHSLPELFSKDPRANQRLGLKSSRHDYAVASLRFAELFLVAEKSVQNLRPYLDSLVWPEDAGNEQVTGVGLDAYLLRVPCFRDSKRAVDTAIAGLEKQAEELRRAKAAADFFAKSAGGHQEGMSSLTSEQLAPAPAPAPVRPGKIPSVPTIRRESDISGTEEVPSAR